MTTSLVRTAGVRVVRSGRRLSTRALGTLGLAWALGYIPIHVYWALGGLSTPIGVTGRQSGFRMANWGACVLIAGAGLTCLALTRRRGAVLPAALRRGVAWTGGVFALAHWALYSTFCGLRVAGVIGYPDDAGLTVRQMHNFDWANLGYFELWFAVMGVLLIACARRNKALQVLRGTTGRGRPSVAARVGTALSLAGIATVIWGVFTFAPWIFAVCGPAVLATGLALLTITNSQRRSR
jgi:hypothetical protein